MYSLKMHHRLRWWKLHLLTLPVIVALPFANLLMLVMVSLLAQHHFVVDIVKRTVPIQNVHLLQLIGWIMVLDVGVEIKFAVVVCIYV